MFIFLLNLFNIWDCYYFRSNLSLVLHIKVLLINKHVTLSFSLLKMKKKLCHKSLCLSGISLRQYCQKSVVKSRRFRKKIKRGDGHIGGLSIEEQGSNLLHSMVYGVRYLRKQQNDTTIIIILVCQTILTSEVKEFLKEQHLKKHGFFWLLPLS